MICTISHEDYCCRKNKLENEIEEGKIIYSNNPEICKYTQMCELFCILE